MFLRANFTGIGLDSTNKSLFIFSNRIFISCKSSELLLAASHILAIILGRMLEVTEIVPCPPLEINSKEVSSSPENKEKLSDSISSMHLFFISSKTFKSPVASFTPIMFGFVQSLLIVLTSILLAVLEGTL